MYLFFKIVCNDENIVSLSVCGWAGVCIGWSFTFDLPCQIKKQSELWTSHMDLDHEQSIKTLTLKLYEKVRVYFVHASYLLVWPKVIIVQAAKIT